ncbi:hypothetical protein LCGC14_0323270 [marine sediment metagenome]|uniref:Uncharacterized protein n=1 Tax=marine sediment metagenome TaxID=412755 RepID=A0A0F9WQT6_9ZZZZ
MPKNQPSADSDSEQAGAATRGTEAGGAAEVVAAGAGAGVAQSGAGAQYGVAGAEGVSDIGQAEAQIRESVRASQNSGDLDQFVRAHYARQLSNAEDYDKTLNSLNQTQREITVKHDDATDTITLAQLANALTVLGLKLSTEALKK